MARKTEAYVDTSGFIAFLDSSDSYHPLFRQLFSEAKRLYTIPLVIAEGQAWFLRRFDSGRALQFVEFIEQLSILEVGTFAKQDLDQAFSVLRRYSDQNLTLVDAAGIAVMKKHKIKTCWSTDRHMSLAGASLAIHAEKSS